MADPTLRCQRLHPQNSESFCTTLLTMRWKQLLYDFLSAGNVEGETKAEGS